MGNIGFMVKLNPYARAHRRSQLLNEQRGKERKEEVQARRAAQQQKSEKIKERRQEYYENLLANPCLYEIEKEESEEEEEEVQAGETEQAEEPMAEDEGY